MKRPDKMNRGITSALFALSIRGERASVPFRLDAGEIHRWRELNEENETVLCVSRLDRTKEKKHRLSLGKLSARHGKSRRRTLGPPSATRRTISPFLFFSIDSRAVKAPNAGSFGKVSLLVALGSLSFSLCSAVSRVDALEVNDAISSVRTPSLMINL